VHGNKEKLYCQNLCLLGKLFLDHKTLYHEVETFQFFVLTEDNNFYNTNTIVGYFSREMTLCEDFNLACIMVLPPYQRKGYGRFLIAFSYYLSGQIDDLCCTPERPLSELGALSYKSYWKHTIFEALKSNEAFKKGNTDITVREISDYTKIQIDDIVLTLESMNLVKYWRGSYLLKNISQRLIENTLKQTTNTDRVVFNAQFILPSKIEMLKSKDILKRR